MNTKTSELTIDSINKHFSNKKVLKGVSLSFESGHRYALLGENGAGKSTLSRIISGSLPADAGTISLNGTPLLLKSPKDAQKAGIAMVHQIPCLADHLSVLENIILGSESARFPGILKKSTAEEKINNLMKQWHITLDIHDKTAALTAQERFHTALLAALYKDPWFLILDEPSASLGAEQRDTLYKTIETMTSSQVENPLAVLFITHTISEAVSNADETIVLRKGIISACYSRGDPRATEESVTCAIFGDGGDSKKGIKPLPVQSKAVWSTLKSPLFTLNDCSVHPVDTPNLYHISLTIPQGAFLAVAGLKEGGLSTLENLCTGFCTARHTGTLEFLGKPVSYLTPAMLRQNGIAIVSSNKTFRSSNPNLTVKDLLVSHWGNEEAILKEANIKATLSDYVSTLSGGMLQKLILTRELAHNPQAVILANPSYGLDAASIQALKDTLTAAHAAGITIIVLTTVKDALFDCATSRYTLESGVLTEETCEK